VRLHKIRSACETIGKGALPDEMNVYPDKEVASSDLASEPFAITP